MASKKTYLTKVPCAFLFLLLSLLLLLLLSQTSVALTTVANNKNHNLSTQDKIFPSQGEKKYRPYFELGGAKYFNQNTNVSGIYDLFIPLFQKETSLVFTDLRIFDRSGQSFEGNVHLGFRKLLPESNQLFGIYGAFDRRKSDIGNLFNQITLGLEYWYNQLFVGGNFYQPIGEVKKLSNGYQETKQTSRSIVITDTKQYEKSLQGFDAEVGYAFTDNLTGYVGGYYFHANDIKTTTGPKIRFNYDYRQSHGRILGIIDGVSVEAGAQYDEVRKKTAYVGIRFKIGLTNLEQNSNLSGFERHMVELVRRDPDIVIGKIKPEVKRIELANKQGYMDSDGYNPNDDSGSANNNNGSESTLEELLKEFGLSENATWQEVKSKWREYALKYHPDRNPKGKSQFVHYSECYEKIEKIFQGRNNVNDPNQLRNWEKRNAFNQSHKRDFYINTKDTSKAIIVYSGGNKDILVPVVGEEVVTVVQQNTKQGITNDKIANESRGNGLRLPIDIISGSIVKTDGKIISMSVAMPIVRSRSELIISSSSLKNKEVLPSSYRGILFPFKYINTPKQLQKPVDELSKEFNSTAVSTNGLGTSIIDHSNDSITIISKVLGLENNYLPPSSHRPAIPNRINTNANILQSRRNRKDEEDSNEYSEPLHTSSANFLSPFLCPISLGLNVVDALLSRRINPVLLGVSALVCIQPKEVKAADQLACMSTKRFTGYQYGGSYTKFVPSCPQCHVEAWDCEASCLCSSYLSCEGIGIVGYALPGQQSVCLRCPTGVNGTYYCGCTDSRPCGAGLVTDAMDSQTESSEISVSNSDVVKTILGQETNLFTNLTYYITPTQKTDFVIDLDYDTHDVYISPRSNSWKQGFGFEPYPDLINTYYIVSRDPAYVDYVLYIDSSRSECLSLDLFQESCVYMSPKSDSSTGGKFGIKAYPNIENVEWYYIISLNKVYNNYALDANLESNSIYMSPESASSSWCGERFKFEVYSEPPVITPYVYGLLSNDVYNDVSQIQNQPSLAGWSVLRSSSDMTGTDASIAIITGYFGRAYINPSFSAVVIAHRGTEPKKDMGIDIITDVGMALCNVVNQLYSARAFVEYVYSYIPTYVVDISFTGHSLGAALAELTSAKYHYKAYTFESPGVRDIIRASIGEGIPFIETLLCKGIVESVQNPILTSLYLSSAVLSALGASYTSADLVYVDKNTIGYCASPNFISTMAQHVGGIYRLYPSVDKLAEIIEYAGKGQPSWRFYVFEYSFSDIAQHCMDGILKEFNQATGYPKVYGIPVEWPSGTLVGYNGYDHYKAYDINTYYWDHYLMSIFFKSVYEHADSLFRWSLQNLLSPLTLSYPAHGVEIISDNSNSMIWGTTNFDDVIRTGTGNDTIYFHGGNDQSFDTGGNDVYILPATGMGKKIINDTDGRGQIQIGDTIVGTNIPVCISGLSNCQIVTTGSSFLIIGDLPYYLIMDNSNLVITSECANTLQELKNSITLVDFVWGNFGIHACATIEAPVLTGSNNDDYLDCSVYKEVTGGCYATGFGGNNVLEASINQNAFLFGDDSGKNVFKLTNIVPSNDKRSDTQNKVEIRGIKGGDVIDLTMIDSLEEIDIEQDGTDAYISFINRTFVHTQIKLGNPFVYLNLTNGNITIDNLNMTKIVKETIGDLFADEDISSFSQSDSGSNESSLEEVSNSSQSSQVFPSEQSSSSSGYSSSSRIGSSASSTSMQSESSSAIEGKTSSSLSSMNSVDSRSLGKPSSDQTSSLEQSSSYMIGSSISSIFTSVSRTGSSIRSEPSSTKLSSEDVNVVSGVERVVPWMVNVVNVITQVLL